MLHVCRAIVVSVAAVRTRSPLWRSTLSATQLAASRAASSYRVTYFTRLHGAAFIISTLRRLIARGEGATRRAARHGGILPVAASRARAAVIKLSRGIIALAARTRAR